MKVYVVLSLTAVLLFVLFSLEVAASDEPEKRLDCSPAPKLCEVAAKLTLAGTFRSTLSKDQATVTIVTTNSLNRLAPLEVECGLHTHNPFVVFAAALYLPIYKEKVHSPQNAHFHHIDASDAVRKLEKLHNVLTAKGCRIDITLWQEEIYDIHDVWYSFPVNAMRNKAVMMAETEVVALLDGDFMLGPRDFGSKFQPGLPMYETAMSILRNHSVLVLPAFQIHIQHNQADYLMKTMFQAAESKTELLSLEVVRPFQEDFHLSTNYTKWRTASEAYEVDFPLAPQREWGYEPYILARKAGLPCYDERFRGYFLNKQEFLYRVWKAGYQFVVHPDVYVVHLPHAGSSTYHAEIQGGPMNMVVDYSGHMRAQLKEGFFKPFVKDGSCENVFS